MERKEISDIAREAAAKVLEGQVTCVSAGMALFRDQTSFRKATPIIFRVNLRGLVSEDDLKIPHSELAMHIGAAGKDLIAFALTGTQTGVATFAWGEGKCGTIFGREDELFKPALVNKVKEMWEKRGPDNPETKYLPCPICLDGKQKPRFIEEGLRYHLREFHKRVDVDELVKLAKEIASEGNPGDYVTIVDPGKTTFKAGEVISREAFEKENERVKKLGEKSATGGNPVGKELYSGWDEEWFKGLISDAYDLLIKKDSNQAEVIRYLVDVRGVDLPTAREATERAAEALRLARGYA